MTNVAALAVIPTTFLERRVDFWASYLMGPLALCIATGLLLFYSKSFGSTATIPVTLLFVN